MMKCERILAVVDFSDNTGSVLEACSHLWQIEKGKLCLLHPEPPQTGYAYLAPGPGFTGFIGFGEQARVQEEVTSVLIEHDRHALELMKDNLEMKGIDAEVKLVIGDRTKDILRAAEDFGADLIVIGGHPHSFFADLLTGNSESALIRHSSIPVLILPSA